MEFHPPLVTALWAGLNGLLALALAVAFTWLAILMACGYPVYLFAIGGR